RRRCDEPTWGLLRLIHGVARRIGGYGAGMRRGRMNLSRREAVATMVAAALMPSRALARDGTRALTDAYNACGQDLFRSFAAKPGNIVFSPYSIGTAMAMVLAGARGETEQQMAAALRHSQGRGEIGGAKGEGAGAVK